MCCFTSLSKSRRYASNVHILTLGYIIIRHWHICVQNDLLEAISITDGVTVAKSDKKECKEEFSLKIYQPSNKSFTPLFLAADTEAEISEWIKEINKAESIGKFLASISLFGFFILSCFHIELLLGAQAVFGVDLSVAVKKNKQSIPVVVERCINYLRGRMLKYSFQNITLSTTINITKDTHNLYNPQSSISQPSQSP